MEFDLEQQTADGHLLYSNFANGAANPDRLALVARLHGLAAPALPGCRVLELGCADGGNLLPLAESTPRASFVGIDLRPEHIEKVNHLAAELGISNIEAVARDLLDLNESFGAFDYVLCHGVFSWVQRDVQDKIFSLCRDLLAPNGLAYINFTALPGSMMVSALRDYLRLTIEPLPPKERVAAGRQALGLLKDALANRQDTYSKAFAEQVEALISRDDGFLFHGYLDVPNVAISLRDFAARLPQYDLTYVADLGWPFLARECDLGVWNERIPTDRLRREEMLDYLEQRSSRRSLLRRANESVATPLSEGSIDDVFVICQPVRSAARPAGIPVDMQAFQNEYGTHMATKDPRIIDALDWLHKRKTPSTIADLKQAVAGTPVPAGMVVNSLEQELVSLASGRFLQLSVNPPSFALTPPAMPNVRPFARHQLASTSHLATNLRHEVVQVTGPDRQVMLLLDGSRNAEAIASQLDLPLTEIRASFDRLQKSSLLCV